MKEVLLCKYGEIVLKGANRAYFEDMLCKELRKRAKKCGEFTVSRAQSTVYVEPNDEFCDMDAMLDEAKKVFGIVSIARAYVCEKSLEGISEVAREYIAPEIRGYRTFKCFLFPFDPGHGHGYKSSFHISFGFFAQSKEYFNHYIVAHR